MTLLPQLPEAWDSRCLPVSPWEAIRCPWRTLTKYTNFFLQEGKDFEESKSLLFMETSAKENYQVSEVFGTVGEWCEASGVWVSILWCPWGGKEYEEEQWRTWVGVLWAGIPSPVNPCFPQHRNY